MALQGRTKAPVRCRSGLSTPSASRDQAIRFIRASRRGNAARRARRQEGSTRTRRPEHRHILRAAGCQTNPPLHPVIILSQPRSSSPSGQGGIVAGCCVGLLILLSWLQMAYFLQYCLWDGWSAGSSLSFRGCPHCYPAELASYARGASGLGSLWCGLCVQEAPRYADEGQRPRR